MELYLRESWDDFRFTSLQFGEVRFGCAYVDLFVRRLAREVIKQRQPFILMKAVIKMNGCRGTKDALTQHHVRCIVVALIVERH